MMSVATCLKTPSVGIESAIALRSVGPIVDRIWAQTGHASVIAKHRRSLYCRAENGSIFCLGAPSIGEGPLNALFPDNGSWQTASAQIPLNVGLRFDADGLTFESGLHLSTRKTTFWHPVPPESEVAPTGQFALRPPVVWPASNAGLAGVLADILSWPNPPRDADIHDPLRRIAWPAIHDLMHWMRTAARSLEDQRPAPESASRLLGLGPGLTPSGDDFLGGVLIALRRLSARRTACAQLADHLWSLIGPLRSSRTNEISAAHLAAAAAGFGHQYTHEVLEALLTSVAPDINPAMRRLTSLGHSSGWDALCGVVAVLVGTDRAVQVGEAS